ncbi:MAG: SRPBCC domain-containing protein [Candidatus Nitrosocaldus sp.]
MHIELEKRYTFDGIEPNMLWNTLKDAQIIARCIPHAEDVHVEGSAIKAKVKPPYSFIRGRLSIEGEIVDVDDTTRQLKVKVKGSSIGSSFNAMLTISVMQEGLIAKVDADTHGLFRTLPSSLIKKVTEDAADRFMSCIRVEIGGSAATTAAS